MNENETIKSVVTSYRLKEDTKEKLKQQLNDLGLTQEEYFNKVVGLMELENVKQNSFLNNNTTIIQSNLNAILNAFINVADSSNNLISNKDVELENVKSKYKDMLFNKELKITQQIEELQQVYNDKKCLQNENDNNKNELDNIKIEHNKELERLESSLNDKTLIVEQYTNTISKLESDLEEFKQYKNINIKLEKELEELKATNNTLENKLTLEIERTTIHKQNHDKLENSINDLKEENKTNIKEIKEEYKKEIENIKEEHTKALEKTIEGNTKATEQLNNSHKIESEKLKNEIEQLKAKKDSEPKTVNPVTTNKK